MSEPYNNNFDTSNFPDLYPKNLQDEVNESYNHDKVLPRVEGQDYNETAQDKSEEGKEGYSDEGIDNIKYT
jgi:hypothetical protein